MLSRMPDTVVLTIVVFVLSGMTSTQAASSNPYCDISPYNLLCRVKNGTWGPSCTKTFPAESIVTPEDKTTILTMLNNYRRQVAKGLEKRGNPGPQPKASNMRQLVWDDELAMMAQTHAQQCEFRRASNVAVSRFPWVRQTVYFNSGKIDWKFMLEYFYDGVATMPNKMVDSTKNNLEIRFIDYAQFVWANTYTVGCGVAKYRPNTGMSGYFHVCHFGPGGLWDGEPIYKRGEPGSACPKGTSNADGLCV